MQKRYNTEQRAPRGTVAGFFVDETRVELHGSREVLIEGSTGVIYYSDTSMRIGLGRQTLLLVGCDLSIRAMFGRTLSVVGMIKSVEFI